MQAPSSSNLPGCRRRRRRPRGQLGRYRLQLRPHFPKETHHLPGVVGVPTPHPAPPDNMKVVSKGSAGRSWPPAAATSATAGFEATCSPEIGTAALPLGIVGGAPPQRQHLQAEVVAKISAILAGIASRVEDRRCRRRRPRRESGHLSSRNRLRRGWCRRWGGFYPFCPAVFGTFCKGVCLAGKFRGQGSRGAPSGALQARDFFPAGIFLAT